MTNLVSGLLNTSHKAPRQCELYDPQSYMLESRIQDTALTLCLKPGHFAMSCHWYEGSHLQKRKPKVSSMKFYKQYASVGMAVPDNCCSSHQGFVPTPVQSSAIVLSCITGEAPPPPPGREVLTAPILNHTPKCML